MITINSNTGPVRVDSWEEIQERANFMTDLDPKEHELKEIIGRYVFPEKVRCGLSNCHAPHERGYIVVTKSGKETNIGKDCGKNYFGVDFQTLSSGFDRMIVEHENRSTLWNFSFKLDEYEQRIAEIRGGDKGANWVNKKVRPLLTPNAGCPVEIVRQLSGMIKTGNTKVATQREASKEEVEKIEALEGRTL